MAVQHPQADAAAVRRAGGGVDIFLPPPALPLRRGSGSRVAVVCALVKGVLAVGVVNLVGFGGAGLIPALAPATRILPSGPPRAQTLARQNEVVLLVPVQQSRITAVLFHPVSGADALQLEPVGEPLGAGIISRIVSAFAASDAAGPSYNMDGEPSSVDVGGPIGTDVYSPVEGKVLSIAPLIVDGIAYGDQIAIEPVANPGVVVVVSGLAADERLSVGTPVSTRPESWTKLGRIVDVTGALDPVLSGYTQDGGNRAHVEVRPATAVAAS